MKKNLLVLIVLLFTIDAVSMAQTTTITFTGVSPNDYTYIGSQNLDVTANSKTLRFNFNNASSSGSQGGPNYYMAPDGSGSTDGTGNNQNNRGLILNEQNNADQLTISFTDNSAFSLNSFNLIDFNVFFDALFPGAGGPAHTLTITGYNGVTQVASFTYDYDYSAANFRKLVNPVTTNPAFGNVTSVVITAAGGFYDMFDDVTVGAAIVAAPAISSATYDASTGSLVVTGTNFQARTGATNDVSVSFLTLTGEGGSTYTLSSSDVEISSATSFSVTLNTTDRDAVNRIINKNGTSSTGGTTYNLAAAATWMAGASSADLSGNGITVSNVAVPSITSATYDASTGALIVTGTGYLSASGATNDIIANKFTFTGEGGTTYTLTDSANPEITSGTSFTITLSATDKAGVNMMLNKNGTSSTGATTYNLAAAEDWAAGANSAVAVADLTANGITVSNVAVPSITSATYDASTGALIVTGTGYLSASGATNDIIANKFTFTGEGGTTYTLTDSANPEITSGTSFTITLSATDKAGVNMMLNKNGTSSTGATTYNLAAAEDWAAGANSAVAVADLTANGITVSNALVTPVITFSNATTLAYAETMTLSASSASSGAITYSVILGNGSISGSTLTMLAGTGTVVVEATQAASSGYSASSAQQTIAASKATQAALVFTSGSTATYGTDLTLTTSGGSGTGTVSYNVVSGDATIINDVLTPTSGTGTVVVSATIAADANYNSVSVNQTIALAKAAQTALAFTSASSATYGTDLTLTTSGGSGTGTVSYSVVSGDATIINDVLTPTSGTGSVVVSAIKAADANYNSVSVNQTIALAKAAQTALAFTSASSATYGTDLTLTTSGGSGTGTVSYSVVSGDATIINNVLTPTSGTGSVVVSATKAADANYNSASENQTITLAKASATLALSDLNPTYDGTAKAATVTTNPSGLGTVAITYNSSATAPSAAGSYAVIASLTSDNYTATNATGNLLIAKAPLTITATGPTKAFGQALTVESTTTLFTASTTQNNEEVSSVTLTPDAAGLSAATAAGQSYTVTPSLATGANGFSIVNYDVNYVAYTGITGVISQSITFNPLAEVTYGDAPVVVTATASSNLPVRYISSNLNVATVNGSTLTLVGAGTTTIRALQDGDVNFTAANLVDQQLIVKQKALTITADDKSKYMGTANPVFTATYSGFVNNETETVLSTAPQITTTASASSPLGTYPIIVSGAVATNYNISYTNGILTVNPGAPTGITFATETLYENRPAGTMAGTLSSTSEDTGATFTYALASGTGDTDNSLFTISGNKISTAAALNYEQKSVYSIRVRSTTQNGFPLDQVLTLSLTDVNELPTLNSIANQSICFTTAKQTIALSGISAGPETGQSVTLSVTADQPELFAELGIDNGQLSYRLNNGILSATAVLTVTVKDDGGTANGGSDTFSRTFNLTANAQPIITISSDLGTNISKGATVQLTASGGITYSWSNAEGILGGQNSAVLTVRPDQNTTYTVTVTNASGCSTTQEILLNVKADYLALDATNIMTPNGDGVNDEWVIRNIDMYPNNEVKIFDRSGRLLFGQKGYTNTWKATVDGSPLAEGTYYYIVDFGNGEPKIRGFITIVRN